MCVENVLPRVLSATEKSTERPTQCEVRNRCLIDANVDGVDLVVARSSWGAPCRFEMTNDIIGCYHRTIQLAGP